MLRLLEAASLRRRPVTNTLLGPRSTRLARVLVAASCIVLSAILGAPPARAQPSDAGPSLGPPAAPTTPPPSAPAPPSSAPAPNTPSAPPAAPGQPSLTPPSLAQTVEAVYPEEARAQGITGAVELLVTIAVDGTVLDAQVVTPAGHGFDEAAVEAVRRFRFEPARRDGQPIASRIRYLYQFELPTPDEPATPPPQTGRLSGLIVNDRDSVPIAAAEIAVVEPLAQTTRRLVSDAEGRFALDDVPIGTYEIQVSASGLQTAKYQETVEAGQETNVVYRLLAAAGPKSESEYGAHAVVAAPPREVSRRTLDRKLMYRIPGTGNDPIRAVEVLPGVSRPPFGNGMLIIRGASPNDSLILVDGVPIPMMYHFGGLRGVVNGQLLRGATLYPGNFSSRYGRVTGGVFELELRDPQTDRLHGVADVSLIEASLMLEGPITKRFSIAASVKRSMFDLVLRALPSGAIDFTAVPSYYDYQFLATWRPTDHDNLRFQFYGSSDRFGLITKDKSEANVTAAENAIDLTSRFNYFQGTWKRSIGANTDQFVTVQTGPTLTHVSAGDDYKLDLDFTQIYGRAEWLTRLAPGLRLVSGVDVFSGHYRATYVGPDIGQSEGNPNPNDQQQVGAHAVGFLFQPGAYVDLAKDIGPVTINGAVRADYFDEIRTYSIDPRLVIEIRLHRQWTWRAGAGLYSQPPQPQESNRTIGNTHLKPILNAQFSNALAYEPVEGVKLGLEGFYKQIWRNVVTGETAAEPKYTNAGIGRIYGLEVSSQVQPTGAHYTGILSYTLLNSERKDHPDLPWRKFDFQQTHGLTLALLYQFPRGYEIGGAVRYYTGNPYTPIDGRVFNATSRAYQPLFGAVNSARNSAFNRVDLRLAKTWTTRRETITFYLDIQNLLNHQNQEAVFYNYDRTQRGVVHGLPIIPALGVRGQF